LKNLLIEIARHGPWPLRPGVTTAATDNITLAYAACAIAGILTGCLAAVTFLLGALVLPARVALLISLCVALAASIPRRQLHGWAQPLRAGQGLILGLFTIAKLEMLSEVDLEWIPVVMISASAWSRAAALCAVHHPVTGLRAASGSARLGCALLGMLPLLFFGIWPEPVWGLWVAALVTLILARVLRPLTWASSIAVRWSAGETVFCLCVLLLMSAATLSEIEGDETIPGS
jgi:hypothetical protein